MDELCLRYLGDCHKPWTGVGHVIKIPDNFGDEVKIELKSSALSPTEIISNFVMEFNTKANTKLDLISVGAGVEDFSSIPTSSQKL